MYINIKNRQFLDFCRKRKYGMWNHCHTTENGINQGVVDFGCLCEKKIKFVDVNVNRNKLEVRSQRRIIYTCYKGTRIGTSFLFTSCFQREISWWSEVASKMASSLATLPLRHPLYFYTSPCESQCDWSLMRMLVWCPWLNGMHTSSTELPIPRPVKFDVNKISIVKLKEISFSLPP